MMLNGAVITAAAHRSEREMIAAVLDANWYRLSRYESAVEAAPAIENIASEIATALDVLRKS